MKNAFRRESILLAAASMGLISAPTQAAVMRAYNYTAGTTISAGTVNSDFNDIYAILNAAASDLTASSSGFTVNKIQGAPITGTATLGQFFVNAGSTGWIPTTLSGDVTASGNPGVLTVTGIQGRAVAVNPPGSRSLLFYDAANLKWDSTAAPTSAGQVLTYNGTDWIPQMPPAGSTNILTAGATGQDLTLSDKLVVTSPVASTTPLLVSTVAAPSVDIMTVKAGSTVVARIGADFAISSPGAGGSSEHFGAGSSAGGLNSSAIGNASGANAQNSLAVGASSNVTPGSDGSTAIGAGNSVQTINTVSVGQGTSIPSASGADNTVAIGQGILNVSQNSVALGQGVNGVAPHSIAIGQGASVTASKSIALGQGASNPVANSMVIGSTASPINELRFISSGTVPNTLIAGSPGTTAQGGTLALSGGPGSGGGAGGDLVLSGGATPSQAGGNVVIGTYDNAAAPAFHAWITADSPGTVKIGPQGNPGLTVDPTGAVGIGAPSAPTIAVSQTGPAIIRVPRSSTSGVQIFTCTASTEGALARTYSHVLCVCDGGVWLKYDGSSCAW